MHPMRTLGGAPYGAVMSLRRWAYERGILASHSADVPVICVGNITTGGTGKTPMVKWVVDQLRAMGKTPAILTRGYKAVDGKSDEAELLAQLTGAKVVVNPDRVAGAKTAVESGADVIVMDDGFQHLQLRRDLDIVLIDATNPFGHDACLPCGFLREPKTALRIAGAIVITRCENQSPEALENLQQQLQQLAPQATVSRAVHAPAAIIDHNGSALPLEALSGKRVLAFCGLGNPGAFFATAENLGATLAATKTFGDHTHYTAGHTKQLLAKANRCDAEILLTTQKDYVKLANLPGIENAKIWQIAVEIKITHNRDELLAKFTKLASTANQIAVL
ncbi:MAG: tetraacyldisaccharide 4'-kinase [Phycisphaerae bacterium]|nr:tetraacyldisaccharide 4'-kinase [Phycisphaerae bacterium]